MSAEQPSRRAIIGQALVLWAVLIVLLAIAAVTAHIDLAPFNVPIMLVAAAIEVALVAVVGMELDRSPALLRLAAVTGVIWLVIMFTLSFSDFLTRAG
ncbi:MAG TPA: oxidase [Hyphomicrobiales bacterium]|nr:oxidase [Hyphomicrobiales bacterium]